MAKTKKLGRDLTSGNVLTTLLIFAAPIILTNMIQMIYSLVDLAVIGQYVGNTGTVGVSVGGEVADFGSMAAMSFAGGGQIYVAQLVGSRNKKLLEESIGTLLGFMAVVSFTLMAFILVFSDFLLGMLNCPAEAYSQAKCYLMVTALGLPFVSGYNAVCSVLRGMGESKRPLIFVSIAATANVFLDILLVAIFKLEALGTAIATVASQIGSFLAAFVYLYKNREAFGFELKLSYFKIRREPLMVILKLGIPRLAQSLFIQGTLVWCNAHINSYGLVVSATNSIGNKIQRMIVMFSNGLDMAAASMIGQCLGAGSQKRASKVVWNTFFCGLVVAVVGSLASVIIPRQLFRIFTPDPQVLDYCGGYMKIQVITFFSAAYMGAFLAMVNGSGFASMGFLIGILDGVVFRVGFALLFANVFHLEEYSYFLGNALARFAPGTLAMVYFLSGKWKTRALLVKVSAKQESEEE